MGQSLEETRRKLPRILSLWSHTDGAYFLQNPIITPCVKSCLSGKLSRNSVPKVFTGGWLHRHPLPSMFQEFRFPDEKQVFNINHIVSTNRMVSVSHSHQLGNGGHSAEILISRCQLRTKLVRSIAGSSLVC